MILDDIQSACLQNERTQHVSVDEQMIAFHGKVRMRPFVRGKPHPVGLKNFVMTTPTPTGIPLDFFIYEGRGRSTESSLVPTPENLNVGGRVVLKLTDSLPIGVSVIIFYLSR
ncbi:Transposase IS4 [Popillia japonica]|uniref:Transposase IS4 n=1 Tax=Popillia japonica TaxID=7064 RepID=A0AAW1KGR9_POPJA